MPTGYSWTRVGQRKVVPYEAPQGRRVNVVGALAADAGGGPSLVFETRRTAQGSYDAAAHLRFVCQTVAGLPAELPAELPAGYRRTRPCVVVLDNYSVHHSRPVKEATPLLEAAGLTFCYLPPYSPELNPIEPVWRQIKYHDLPERSHPTEHALQEAVETALHERAQHLCKPQTNLPRST